MASDGLAAVTGAGDSSPQAEPEERLSSVPARYWWMLALLFTVNMFSYMDRMALGILLQSIKVDMHLSDTQLGLLTGVAFLLFYCVMGLPLARLADRSSRVKLLAACVGLWSIATAATGSARSFTHLFLARVGVGIGEAGCSPSAHSLIADAFPRRLRTLAIAIFQTGTALGVGTGLIVVGLLGQYYGWRTAMQAIGLAGIPLALLLFFTVREPPRNEQEHEAKESAWQSIKALLGRPAYVHLLIAMSLAGVANSALTQWLPTFLIRSFGMNMAQIGASLGTVTLFTGIIGMLGGGLAATWLQGRDVRWELWLPGLAMLFSAPVYLAAMFSHSAWFVIGLKIPYNFLHAISAGASFGAVQVFAAARQRGMAISMVQLASSVAGMGLGSFLIGWMSDMFEPGMGKESLRYALIVASVAMPLSALFYYLSARRCRVDRVG